MAAEPTDGPITGLGGKVSVNGSELADVQNWKANLVSANQKYTSSSTGGWEKNLPGNKSWTAVFEVFLDQGDLSDANLAISTLIDLILKMSATKNITGEARIAYIDVGVDIAGADFEGVTITVDGNGEYAIS